MLQKSLQFLYLVVLFFTVPSAVQSTTSCDECLDDDMFVESISRPFKKCLRETTLTRESLTEHYKLVWQDTSWEFGWFSRDLTAFINEDQEKYPDKTDDFDIRFCSDYRKALSLIYEDLDLLHDYSTAQNLKNIAEHERANLKNFEELKSCNTDLSLQTRKSDKQEVLAEIKFLEKAIKRRQEQITFYQEWIVSDEVKYAGFFKDVEKAEKKINTIWFSQLDWCLENHEHPNAFYERGMLHFSLGQTFEALGDIEQFLETLDPTKNLAEELFFRGQCEAELGLYQEAVFSLSKALKKDPSNKDIYFERAAAYLELGCFEESLLDYVTSGIKPKPFISKVKDKLDFSLGLHSGALNASADAAIDFLPSLWNFLIDTATGLWTFAVSPVEVSADLVDGAIACAKFLKNSTALDKVYKLVPELQPLVLNWDQTSSYKKGEIIGQVIGKYGVEIFASAGVLKSIKAYRDLKRASRLLTLEAAAVCEKNKAVFAIEAAKRAERRAKAFSSVNLNIQLDKQGKHVVGHRNYVPADSKSIFQHSDPQRLANEFAGKGMKLNKVSSGTPGYRELVNFGEPIGYAVDEKTGEAVATTWGKIHYAKDGVHIVPAKPR